jgi:hypothetical protein
MLCLLPLFLLQSGTFLRFWQLLRKPDLLELEIALVLELCHLKFALALDRCNLELVLMFQHL